MNGGFTHDDILRPDELTTPGHYFVHLNDPERRNDDSELWEIHELIAMDDSDYGLSISFMDSDGVEFVEDPQENDRFIGPLEDYTPVIAPLSLDEFKDEEKGEPEIGDKCLQHLVPHLTPVVHTADKTDVPGAPALERIDKCTTFLGS